MRRSEDIQTNMIVFVTQSWKWEETVKNASKKYEKAKKDGQLKKISLKPKPNWDKLW